MFKIINKNVTQLFVLADSLRQIPHNIAISIRKRYHSLLLTRTDLWAYYLGFSERIMSSVECMVCAWRIDCTLKFNYQKLELNCREFTKDVNIGNTEEGHTVDSKNKDRKNQ